MRSFVRSGTAKLGVAIPATFALLLTLSAPLSAQTVTLGAGVSPYDLSGTGTGVVASGRFVRELSGAFSFEVGGSIFRYTTQAGNVDNLLLPELGVRVSAELGAARGYLAVGAGAHVTVVDRREAEPTVFAAMGLDVPLSGAWGLQPEVRFRSVDPWVGSMMDVTLALRRRLGG